MDRLTDREWKVMEALWQGGPQTLGEVLARLAEDTGWSRTTVHTYLTRMMARKSQAFIARKFSVSFLFNFDMTIWPPSIPLVGSLRFSLLCSSCPLQFPPFSHASHTAYADNPISRKQARKATSLLIYPSIFRG